MTVDAVGLTVFVATLRVAFGTDDVLVFAFKLKIAFRVVVKSDACKFCVDVVATRAVVSELTCVHIFVTVDTTDFLRAIQTFPVALFAAFGSIHCSVFAAERKTCVAVVIKFARVQILHLVTIQTSTVSKLSCVCTTMGVTALTISARIAGKIERSLACVAATTSLFGVGASECKCRLLRVVEDEFTGLRRCVALLTRA
jgi:hypothetical protein